MISHDFSEFVDAIANMRDKKELTRFLQSILTPNEIKEIPTRLAIVKLLKKGSTQREICEKLGVGVATVTRGSLEIKKGSFKNIT